MKYKFSWIRNLCLPSLIFGFPCKTLKHKHFTLSYHYVSCTELNCLLTGKTNL